MNKATETIGQQLAQQVAQSDPIHRGYLTGSGQLPPTFSIAALILLQQLLQAGCGK